MKKGLLLLTAGLAFAAGSANAGWYISGAFQGWSHCNPSYELKEAADKPGVYELSVDEIYGEFLLVEGEPETANWDTKIGSNGTDVMPGEAYSYVPGGGNFRMADTVESAKILLDTNAQTLTVSGEIGTNHYDTVYLVGDFGEGWSESTQAYPLALKSGTDNVWSGTYELTAETSYFKMRAGNNIYGTGEGDVAVELGKEYVAAMSGNAFSIGAGVYAFEYVLDTNADTGVLTVTETTIFNPAQDDLFLRGAMNDWGTDPAYLFKEEDGNYVLHLDALEAGVDFKCASQDWATHNYSTDNFFMQRNVVYDLNYNTGNMAMGVSLTDVTITVDLDNMAIFIDGKAEDNPEPPVQDADLYLIGAPAGRWAANIGAPMEKVGEYQYSWTGELKEDDYFAFTAKLGADESDWATLNENRFSPEKDATPIELNTPMEMFNQPDGAWCAGVNGTYTILVDMEEMTFTVSEATGVATIGTAEGEAVYFNLQGVRVANPEKGMFIRVQGGKAVKVVK